LVSPRRYGKSSLVHHVVSESKLPFASIDLFLAHDDKAIIKRILTGIAEIVSQILPLDQKILQKLQALFSKFRVSLSVSHFLIETTYNISEVDAADQIFSGLLALQELAKAEHKKVIFFIDEFQDIASAESAKSIQGAIRHIAQATSEIIFIFSGSNRHLLLELFDDKSMPLYMLCDKIYLDRMSSESYKSHLQKLAEYKWGSTLSEANFYKIMALTELHPFYVNLLCNRIWENKNPPTEQQIIEAWNQCYEDEKRRLVVELEKLTRNQQEVIKSLAFEPTNELSSQTFIAKTGMASSSILQSTKALFERDMIFKVTFEERALPFFKINQVRVLDPLLAYALRQYG